MGTTLRQPKSLTPCTALQLSVPSARTRTASWSSSSPALNPSPASRQSPPRDLSQRNSPPSPPHVASGRIIQVDVPHTLRTPQGNIPIIRHYFCLPTEEWRIKVMEVMEEVMARPNKGGFTENDLHRLDGTLLGYTKTDIETFIRSLLR